MKRFEIFTTQDGSLGLYNNEVGDIYHSKFGAYSESINKFITPSNFKKFVQNNDSARVLDICYGIGYNSKSAIQTAAETKSDFRLCIDAIEPDQELVLFSALCKAGCYDDSVNYNIACEIIKQRQKFTFSPDQNFINYFSPYSESKRLKSFVELFSTPINTPLSDLNALLHNIYYHSVSNSNKTSPEAFKINKLSLNWYLEDARLAVKKLDNAYDFIFLDAFTPNIMPSLWSYEFFKELYRLLNSSGMLVTYSSAAPVRSAMLKAGLFTGKVINGEGKSIGTVASKDESLIEIPLSEAESGLLKTKAGICYTDKGLCNTDEEIIKNYNLEKQNSDRISSSSYMKKIGAEKCMI